MKNLPFIIIRLLVLSAFFVAGVVGNTTTLDTTFNGTGYRLQTVGAESAYGYSLAIQTDGKIVVAGRTGTVSQTDQFALLRLNVDGTLDTSFGSGGSVFSPDGVRAVSWEPTVLIQPDGKILLGATAWMVQQQTYSFIIFRYTSEGLLDTTFNNTGYATGNIPDSYWDICNSMTLQADGKIVLAGQALTTPGQALDWDLAVMRFNADGSPDTTFDGDGVTKLGTPPGDEEAHSVFVQASGKILVGGRGYSVEKFLLTRLNSDGSIDTSFAANGWSIFQLDFTNNNIASLAQQSDGKILAGGGGKIVRFTADGIRDMSFATNGVQTATGTIEHFKIHVIGGDKFLIGTRYGAHRFMANGAVDTHFGRDFNVSGNRCFIRSIAVQSDDKVLLGGYCSNNSDNIYRFAVARFQENRTMRYLDFDGDERTDISIFRPSNGNWRYLESATLYYQISAGQVGMSTDRPVPADFTGDGKADPAVFRPSTGEWLVLRSDNGSFYSFTFGMSGDIPVPADYDGDQIDDVAVFRPSTAIWFILKSTGGIAYEHFGLAGDKLVPSDYDGDFKTDLAIYRPSSGQWWIRHSSDGSIYAFTFGMSSDIPIRATTPATTNRMRHFCDLRPGNGLFSAVKIIRITPFRGD